MIDWIFVYEWLFDDICNVYIDWILNEYDLMMGDKECDIFMCYIYDDYCIYVVLSWYVEMMIHYSCVWFGNIVNDFKYLMLFEW